MVFLEGWVLDTGHGLLYSGSKYRATVVKSLSQSAIALQNNKQKAPGAEMVLAFWLSEVWYLRCNDFDKFRRPFAFFFHLGI